MHAEKGEDTHLDLSLIKDPWLSLAWSLPFREIGLQQTEIGLPLVSHDLAAGEASHWDNHLGMQRIRSTMRLAVDRWC